MYIPKIQYSENLEKKHLAVRKADKKAALLKKLQAEIDRRTKVENEAISLISSGEYEKARELLESLDNQAVKDIEAELDKLNIEK